MNLDAAIIADEANKLRPESEVLEETPVAIKADEINKLRSESEVLEETPVVIKADEINKLRSESGVLEETPVAVTGNADERSAFRQALGYIPGVVQLAQSNKLRSLKDKAVAFCGNIHEKRDKVPLPVEYAFRRALCCVPGGGLAVAATDALMMVGSLGKSGGDDQIIQSPGPSLRELFVEVQTRMSELEMESDALKDMQTRVSELEKVSDALRNLSTRVSELEMESDALKNQLNLVVSLLKKQVILIVSVVLVFHWLF